MMNARRARGPGGTGWRARLALVAAVVGGAAAGDAAWRGAVERRASAPPTDWVEEAPQVPRRLASLMGTLPPRSHAWNLDFWRTLWPRDPHLRSGPAPIHALVHLPEDGQVELWVSRQRGAAQTEGVGLLLDRVGEPGARVVQVQRGVQRTLPCSDSLPAPTGTAVFARVEPRPGGVQVDLDGVVADCAVALPQHGPALRAGLRRVQLEDVVVGEIALPPPGPVGRPLWWLVGAAVCAAVVLVELSLAIPAGVVLVTTLPLLLAAALLRMDLAGFVETARLPWLDPRSLGAGLPLALSLGLKAMAASLLLLREPSAQRDWPRAAAIAASVPASLAATAGGLGAGAVAVALGVCAAVGALLPSLLRWLGSAAPVRSATMLGAAGSAGALAMGFFGPLHSIAVPLAGAAALAFAGLLWANSNPQRVRAYNWTSLLLALAVCAATEGAIRYTVIGVAWSDAGSRTRPDDIYGWVPAAEESFTLLEEGQHTTYPDKGFPVKAPATSGRPRVVSFGGSTTGGAFQNDDLADFYPALLEQRLGGRVEVLNQGVGGWTTFHIRRYAGDHLASLQPDVITLYVGHNDLLTPAPVPYAQLYAAWEGGGSLRRVSDGLRQLRLYQGLRYLLVAMRPAAQRVAVPVDHARDNLLALITQMEAREGRVILASEGLAPDPGPLQGYFRMMQSLARESDAVSFVDTATRLHDAPQGPVFLDDCHLTERGHRIVADALEEELRRLGVVDAAHAQP